MMTTESQTYLDLQPLSTGGDDSVLAGVWRKIISDLNITESQLFDRIDAYAEKVSKNDSKKASQIRGNLRTDVGKAGMTWFTFTKCLRVLGVEKVDLNFKLKRPCGDSLHDISFELEDNFFEKTDRTKEEDPSVLSVFFQKIRYELGIGIRAFEVLLEDYIRRENIAINLKTKTSARGYLKKDFSSLKMSWRNFIKALVFLCCLKIRIKIVLHFKKKVKTVHTYHVLLSEMEDYSKELIDELRNYLVQGVT